MNTHAVRARARFVRSLGIVTFLGASAALWAQDVGYQGPSLTGSGPTVGEPSVTASKPENKLWYHDGQWWGSMWSATAQAFRIHRLERATQTWIDTGVAIESRRDSHADALSDGNKLYIATHEFATGEGDPGHPLLVLRYTYAGGTYSLDAGFPVQVGDWSTESAVIEKDSTGTLWLVWMEALRTHYSHTMGSDTVWSAPAVLPAIVSDATGDDICSVVHFGNRIGVLWNDDNLSCFFFSVHVDGQPGTTWQPYELIVAQSDDHINLSADSAGRVFAVVKNDAEQVRLFVRGAAGGWSVFPVSSGADALSRPIVLLDEDSRTVHVFASYGGSIYEKTSSMDTIAFGPGRGRLVIRDDGSTVNNPTSTKQNVTAQSGIVVLAANLSTAGNYWHHYGLWKRDGFVLTGSTPAATPSRTVNLFSVSGGTPGGTVVFTGGLAASRPIGPQDPEDATSGLDPSFRLVGTARSDARGVATLEASIPASLATSGLVLQAFEPGSRLVSNRIQVPR